MNSHVSDEWDETAPVDTAVETKAGTKTPF